MPIYNPPPTDAVLLNPDGSVNGPVNPDLCASKADCNNLVANLRGAGIIPHSETVLVQDEPWTIAGPDIRYGKDGRRVFGLHFTANGIEYWENVEACYVWLKRAPYPGSQWKLTPVDLIRVGNVVGASFGKIADHAPEIVLRRRTLAEGSVALPSSLVGPHFPLRAPNQP